ncbi:transglycosylase SLT domain-containing protein [Aurantimonas sp. C2-6-R+9]|uniref:lytic transglycosylase domain-containing protein n=1 Tax=unclassified Aurantimonas TaxID=2638230 RepID=UPI002E16BDC1|nr:MULTISPECIES: transglycosylase SLT domain-containing protein [unclassified Aurantimonas]MEC5292060.1 transglycosylase SLT domain-containing protein [Aurantimonas sp. C2-3-R2]MEC5382186.1 transglycosylase SLT domain-containing protein [Aurantimonas sp. C2-6-R+9]MEC5413122.1 transglycosylase SLT domain-containing protein [Aurantimonas sp. C2-4-R8]
MIPATRRAVTASTFAIVAIASLSGCVAGGSPLATALESAQTDTATEAEVAALATGVAPSDGDVKIAAREAKQATERGTISGSASLDRMIEEHARENGIPPALAYAVVRVESRYNPKARGAGGVYGLSQIKPATARSMGFSGSANALFDPDTNLTYGMKYLKGAWEQGGRDVCKASMKYKGGLRTTRMSASAARYCSAVKAHMAEIVKRRRMPAVVEAPAEEPGLIGTLVAAVTPSEEPSTSTKTRVRAVSAKPVQIAAPKEGADQVAVAAAPAAAPRAESAAATGGQAAVSEDGEAKGGRIAAADATVVADDAALADRMAGTADK